MKQLVALALAVALAGCNDPKSLVLPSDLAKVGDDKEFIEQVKTLPQEDKDLLTGYMARSALSQAFTKEPAPIGVTVGEAIEQQRQWLKQQEAAQAIEKEAQAKALAELEKNNALLRDALQIVYVKRGDLTKHNYQTYMPIYFQVTNRSGKAISGFKADVEFMDQFGASIKAMQFEESKGIPAEFDQTVTYFWQYNQFDDEWNKLLSLEDGKFTSKVQATHIIFEGGDQLVSR